MNATSPTLILAVLLWLISGCMTQTVRDNAASTAETDNSNAVNAPEVVAAPVPAGTRGLVEAPGLPKLEPPATAEPARDTGTIATVETHKTTDKPAAPASTAATPTVKKRSKQPDAKPEADSSTDNRLALAKPISPLPGPPPVEAQAAIPRPDITHLDLASLPLSFGQQWVLDRRPNPATKKVQCILASKTVNIPDGQDRTNVQVLLTPDSLYVNTDSNIDLSYPETGIRIGGGMLRPFDRLVGQTAAMVSGDDIPALYARMTDSPNMVVRLGFWPTWPITETREASYSLEDFRNAVTALRACNRM